MTSLSSLSAQEKHPAFSERTDERKRMVYKEVGGYPNIHIWDSEVLDAMFRVPRHAFVPDDVKDFAYFNQPLPIGFEQTISQPVIVASMTQLLGVKKNMKILEIGTGSGYQAAVLEEMGAEVYSIEIVEPLGERAEVILKELGYTGIHLKIGDGYNGWPEYAPFDRIIVTCAPEEVPQPLVEQLIPGGRIVIPLGAVDKLQYIVVLEKNKKGKLEMHRKYPVRFVPMTGKAEE